MAAGGTRASVPPGAIDSARDAANEDFLFHLYRGSELLQDNRVLEAKSELEYALTLQPRDPKGQDLLAHVYFRIGLYPRAIQIYEELLRDNSGDLALRLNLALCYLKTGQAQSARLELEHVVAANPTHKRAWGYLGLAFERLGDFDKAQHSFERGGHTAMAKRMAERALERTGAASLPLSAAPRSVPAEQVRAAAAMAFQELDAGELSFALAEPQTGKVGTWEAVEPGTPTIPAPPASPAASTAEEAPRQRRRYDTLDWGLPKSEPQAPPPSTAPRGVTEVVRDARLEFPETAAVLLAGGLALVRTTPERPFAVRLEAVRSFGGDLAIQPLARHTRGQSTQETLGGVATPIVRIEGDGQLVLGPLPVHAIVGFHLRDDVAFLREDLLLGFDGELAYENGKLAVGESDSLSMVQLRGSGAVLLEMRDRLAAVETSTTRAATVRREVVVGWIGRLVPRAIPLSEAPCGQRGLVRLAGDGAVLLAAK